MDISMSTEDSLQWFTTLDKNSVPEEENKRKTKQRKNYPDDLSEQEVRKQSTQSKCFLLSSRQESLLTSSQGMRIERFIQKDSWSLE